MKIALINESSVVAKNRMILEELKGVCEPLGHQVFNYGMSEEDPDLDLSYVDIGYLTAILLNAKAVDFVVTGCSSGEGACMASNSYPGVYCGYIKDPVDAYLFGQINDGNAISLSYNKDFGLAGELNLRYIFREYFQSEHGIGYPQDRAALQRAFQKYFAKMKSYICDDMGKVVERTDPLVTRKVCSGQVFQNSFFANCAETSTTTALRTVLGEDAK